MKLRKHCLALLLVFVCALSAFAQQMPSIPMDSNVRVGKLENGLQDPLRAYTIEGLDMYENMLMNIDKDITLLLLKAEVRQNTERKEVTKNKYINI